MALRESPDTDKEAGTFIGGIVELLRNMDHTKIFVTCTSCRHLSKGKTCTLFNVDPPAHVAVKGCDKFADKRPMPPPNPMDDDIPF